MHLDESCSTFYFAANYLKGFSGVCHTVTAQEPQHLVYPVWHKCAESARKWHRASRYEVRKNQKFEVALGMSPQKARQAAPGNKKGEKAGPDQPAVDGCQQAPRSSLCTDLRVLLSQGLFSLTRA